MHVVRVDDKVWPKASCLVRCTVSTSVSSGIITKYIIIDGNPTDPHMCGEKIWRERWWSKWTTFLSDIANKGARYQVWRKTTSVEWLAERVKEGSTYLWGPGESKRELKFFDEAIVLALVQDVWVTASRGPSNSNLWVHCNASSDPIHLLDPLVVWTSVEGGHGWSLQCVFQHRPGRCGPRSWSVYRLTLVGCVQCCKNDPGNGPLVGFLFDLRTVFCTWCM